MKSIVVFYLFFVIVYPGMLHTKIFHELQAVIPNDIDYVNGFLATRGNGLFDLRWDHRKNFPMYETFFFQLPQLTGQHFMRDMRDIFF